MKRLILLWLCLLLGSVSTVLYGTARVYNVLYIHSYSRHSYIEQQWMEGLRKGFSAEGIKVNLTMEYVDADFWPYESERFIMRRICERARQRNTDLILTGGDETFYSLMTCGDSLPYRLPVVYSDIKYPDSALMQKASHAVGFLAEPDYRTLIEEAIRLFPQRKRLVCLSDNSHLSRCSMQRIRETWYALQPAYPDYTLIEMNVETTPLNSIISAVCFDNLAYRYTVIASKWTPFLRIRLKAPLFICHNNGLNQGALGVYDVSPHVNAVAAGKLAARLLSEKCETPLPPVRLPQQFVFDYKQLRYFRVDINKADVDGNLINVSLMERFAFWIYLAYALLLTGLGVAVFFLVRAYRKEARKRMQVQTHLLVQQRLVEQRNEFDNILCSIRDAMLTYDTEMHLHFMNRAMVEMLGLQGETYDGYRYEGRMAGAVYGIYHRGKDILTDLLRTVLQTARPLPIPENAFMQARENGRYFPISGEVVPIFSGDKLNGAALICHNISEEEMLKKLFNLVVVDSDIYPWSYDMEAGVFTYQNGFLQRLGLPDGTTKLEKSELDKRIHPDDVEAVLKGFACIDKEEGQSLQSDMRLRNQDGTYEWWEFRRVIYEGLRPDEPYRMLGICQSIQKYKDAEAELIEARDQALQADRLKTAFLANMSHEIRTPLNAIVGFSDLLRDIEAFSSEEISQFVGSINENSALLLALINDILDMSRIEAGTMEFVSREVNLSHLFMQVYDSQNLNMPPGVLLRTALPEGEDTLLWVDPVRLKQVVNNLINNAKKFTKQGHITIGYRTDEADKIVLFVQDTGCGITAEQQQHIFDRFYKGDNFTQGAGLGLSICKTIVDRMQGEIHVSSEPGKGTCFEVHLPRTGHSEVDAAAQRR